MPSTVSSTRSIGATPRGLGVARKLQRRDDALLGSDSAPKNVKSQSALLIKADSVPATVVKAGRP
jgi:hypothetical protein